MKQMNDGVLTPLLNVLFLSFKRFLQFWVEPLNFHVKRSDMEKLQVQRFTHPHPLVRRLLHALYFQGLHISVRKTCKYAGISSQALRLVRKIYLRGGVEEIKRLGSRIPRQALS